ncbi:hypothetical protein O1M63_43655 [Streptomyces mirabilis]|nr:hypothetical protein [Streptomyces mirabilis]
MAAAFALGAAYVVTGTVNQMSVEAAISDRAKALLAEARVTDVAMAPSSDMFEIGAKVQVLRRGTMFAAKADRLRLLYDRYPSLEALPDATRTALEREVFGSPIAEVWEATRAYLSARDPAVIARAEADPRHRMALVFRWYLGSSSLWAIDGRPDRAADYQRGAARPPARSTAGPRAASSPSRRPGRSPRSRATSCRARRCSRAHTNCGPSGFAFPARRSRSGRARWSDFPSS